MTYDLPPTPPRTQGLDFPPSTLSSLLHLELESSYKANAASCGDQDGPSKSALLPTPILNQRVRLPTPTRVGDSPLVSLPHHYLRKSSWWGVGGADIELF